VHGVAGGAHAALGQAAAVLPGDGRVGLACAAHLLAALEDGADALPGGVWYAAFLVEGLEAGGPDELVASARTAVDAAKRAAA
jgi:hypothetical protein